MKLTRKNLVRLKDSRGIEIPEYDKPITKPAIVHLGVGGFHRAHMARYCDLLLKQQTQSEWHICGVGVLAQDSHLQKKLTEQDYLYSLVELAQDTKVSVIGAITDYLLASDNPSALLEKLAAPETKIISLTITESGYPYNQSTKSLVDDLPDVAHDLAFPASPRTAFGYITYALYLRMMRGLSGLTLLSCDNVSHNGDVSKHTLLAYAYRFSDELAQWIEGNVSFPNSMVDRITPVTTAEHIQRLKANYAIEDKCPVVCESFSMWILEDKFANGRPDWDNVGVRFTQDVGPFETMKLSLLNASHTAMAYLGYLGGYTFTYEVMEDKQFCEFLIDFMTLDVMPILPEVPGIDLNLYIQSLLERFSNRYCADLLTRLCFDGSGKIPQFLIPTINTLLNKDKNLNRVALIIASWVYYLSSQPIQHIADPRAEELILDGGNRQTYYLEILKYTDIFGANLAESVPFKQTYFKWLTELEQKPVNEVLSELLSMSK